MNRRPLGYEDSEAPFNSVRHPLGSFGILRQRTGDVRSCWPSSVSVADLAEGVKGGVVGVGEGVEVSLRG